MENPFVYMLLIALLPLGLLFVMCLWPYFLRKISFEKSVLAITVVFLLAADLAVFYLPVPKGFLLPTWLVLAYCMKNVVFSHRHEPHIYILLVAISALTTIIGFSEADEQGNTCAIVLTIAYVMLLLSCAAAKGFVVPQANKRDEDNDGGIRWCGGPRPDPSPKSYDDSGPVFPHHRFPNYDFVGGGSRN
jgi:hypothetical protein